MQSPNFFFEKKYWKKGYKIVIGVDEVGRGSLAGPVVAAACVLRLKIDDSCLAGRRARFTQGKDKKTHDSNFLILDSILRMGIDDSKRLTPKRREQLAPEIKKYFYSAKGKASVKDINRLGIVKATEKAMRKAITNLIENYKVKIPKQNPFVLVDAFHVKYISGVGLKNQQAVKHGDQRSISIAAASIIAKVHRDNLMQKYAKDYKIYHFEKKQGIRYQTTLPSNKKTRNM